MKPAGWYLTAAWFTVVGMSWALGVRLWASPELACVY